MDFFILVLNKLNPLKIFNKCYFSQCKATEEFRLYLPSETFSSSV